mmetsp:Transcript_8185/g.13792  ORF Transcript_8185/g.13792 Transcript_8185/m.13792 type:complete len:259 (+) Transcript_8185:169-945(+)
MVRTDFFRRIRCICFLCSLLCSFEDDIKQLITVALHAEGLAASIGLPPLGCVNLHAPTYSTPPGGSGPVSLQRIVVRGMVRGAHDGRGAAAAAAGGWRRDVGRGGNIDHWEVLLVLIAAVDEATGHTTSQLDGARVWRVVDGRAIQQHEHPQQLQQGPRLVPRLTKGRSHAIEDQQIGAPHRGWTEVIEDGMPHRVELVGDQAGEDVVHQDGGEVHGEHKLHRQGVAEHHPGVEGILEGAVVLSGIVVGHGIHDAHTD